MKLQRQQHYPHVLTMFAILALLGGGLLWILNLLTVIPGPWANILVVVFTMLGVIFTFLQWQTRSQAEVPPKPSNSLNLSQQPELYEHLVGIPLGMNRRRGALIVKAKKKHLGATVYLCRGFDGATPIGEIAANVVERRINNSSVFIGIFHLLEAGNYTAYLHNPIQGTPVTIYPNHLSEIDWRYKEPENSK
jgi:hypothetical protein